MKINVNFHRFQDAFTNYGRGNQFSYEALQQLFNYLEQLEEDTGEEIELDVIALCCEYTEIDEDDKEYSEYVGDDAHLEDLIIAQWPGAILVRQS